MSNSATEEHIRQKAYELWIGDGRPRGADQLYWLKAQRDLVQPFHSVDSPRGVEPAPTAPSSAPPKARLRGHIDTMTTARIAGWVQDESEPHSHLEVVIMDAGVEIARFVASTFRSDLRTAGIGDGCYAYDYIFPPGFWATSQHTIAIVFPADPAWICSNPMTAA